LDEVVAHGKQNGKGEFCDSMPGFWRVLIVDQTAMRILSASTKVHDLTAKGVTVVEDIKKVRQPMPAIDAIYLLAPTEESVLGLMKDFEHRNNPMYKSAHVYFTERE
jgi:syntaxin-binding protein 1